MIKCLSSSNICINLVHVIFWDVLYTDELGFVLSPDIFSVMHWIAVTASAISVLCFLQISVLKKTPLFQKVVYMLKGHIALSIITFDSYSS